MNGFKQLIIIGFGGRGVRYADFCRKFPEKFKVAAVIEPDERVRRIALHKYGYSVFENIKLFFDAKIKVDAAVISAPDKDHLDYALLCMRAGYDILLEKPIACSLEDCQRIEAEQKKSGAKVVVCHVLRYTPYYRRIKEVLDSGTLGEVVSIHASENVGYYHQAHSFVRGPWKSSTESCPMIVAKCCHDMDIIRWLVGKRCEKISSFGGLKYFTETNAPKESTDFCSDCNVRDCVYRAQDIYARHHGMASYFCKAERTDENIAAALKHSQYDRCVYRSGNDVVDHQVAIMQFEDDITACFTMTAFSKEIYRDIKIYGTKGELTGVVESNVFEVKLFGGETFKREIDLSETQGGHGGGDIGIMNAFYDILCGNENADTTFLNVSMDSHKMAFGAERSRLTGKVVEIL